MKEEVGVLKSLGNATRLRIMLVLMSAGRELCICEIMDSLGLPQYHISKHIRELKITGLVEEREEGRFVFYRISRRPVGFVPRLLNALEGVDGKILVEDRKRMKKRLSLRVRGKCVVGLIKEE